MGLKLLLLEITRKHEQFVFVRVNVVQSFTLDIFCGLGYHHEEPVRPQFSHRHLVGSTEFKSVILSRVSVLFEVFFPTSHGFVYKFINVKIPHKLALGYLESEHGDWRIALRMMRGPFSDYSEKLVLRCLYQSFVAATGSYSSIVTPDPIYHFQNPLNEAVNCRKVAHVKVWVTLMKTFQLT